MEFWVVVAVCNGLLLSAATLDRVDQSSDTSNKRCVCTTSHIVGCVVGYLDDIVPSIVMHVGLERPDVLPSFLLCINIPDDGLVAANVLHSLTIVALSLACRNRTHPIAIDAANKASGIVGIILIFPVIVSSKMLLAVHCASRLAAKATYLAERVSSSRCFCTYSWFLDLVLV